DRVAGQAAGEQPWRGGRGSGRGGGAAGVDQFGEGVAERLGDGNVVIAEADVHGAVPAGDLAGGHGGDPGQLLAVEQEQASGGAVGEVEGVVVQQPGGQGPALVLAGCGAAAAGRGGGRGHRAGPPGGGRRAG